MKKNLLLLSLGLASASLSPLTQAAHLTPAEALARIKSETPTVATKSMMKASPRLQTTIDNLYIFSAGTGYMVLPAYDEAPAILGYSDNEFQLEGNPELEYWLGFYNKQLSTLKGGSKNVYRAVERKERKAIEPLTLTKWNQEAPYNDLCPELNGERSVTGCVATAMAQVMRYHSWPAKGVGKHSYFWKAGNDSLSFDYGSTTFDWDNMTYTYGSDATEAQRKAVATLMLSCGISVDMNYSPDESGASTMVMGQSLMDYYNYDKALWMPMRDYYGIEEWEKMIYADLEKGLPVLYAGQGTDGGHQFICDGYSSDGYFHFNWGWGGMSNGYFLLTALNPPALGVGGGAGGFNSSQQIALGVRPPVEGSKPTYLMYCTTSFTPEQQMAAAGEPLTVAAEVYNFSMEKLPADALDGMHIVSADGSYDEYIGGESLKDMPLLSGYKAIEIYFPSLEDGTYTITPAYYAAGKWNDMKTPVGQPGSISADVQGGAATLSTPQAASVTVSDINLPSALYIDREFPLSFSVTNPGSEEYMGHITPVLIDENENLIAESVYSPVDILAGETMDITDYIGKFSAPQGQTLEAGTYYLAFIDDNGNLISEPQEVAIQEAPAETSISISAFSLVSENPITSNKDAVKFSVTVDCTEGYFSDEVTVAIFKKEPGTLRDVASGTTGMLYINSGESRTATPVVDMSALEPGDYFAALFGKDEKQISDKTVDFTISDNESGIVEIGTDSSASVKIYNLQGQPCKAPLQPGIYIIDGKKIMVR